MTRGGCIGILVAGSLACGNGAIQTGFDGSTGPQHQGDGSSQKLPGMTLSPDGGGDTGTQVFTPSGPVNDFPTPVFDGTAPSTSATLFGPKTPGATSGGPCIAEPESNVLYPQDWLRPRFRWTPMAGQNLFEL